MDFPTLGLNFDLNDLIAGLNRLAAAKREYIELGRAAEKTGDDVEGAGRQIKASSLEAEAAAFRAARGHNGEEEAIKRKLRAMRDLERIEREIARVEKFARDRDPEIQELMRVKSAVRGVGQAMELVARENQRLTREKQQGWNRVADAIRMAADQTVRAANIDAEARVRITQAQIAQNRQGALTQESLTREALLVDRLTKELNELGQARAAAARQGAAPGANADLLGRAAATTVVPVIAAAQSGLGSRAAQLAENEAREKGRRGIMSYILALIGLGGAYDSTDRKQKHFGNSLTGLGGMMRRVRLAVFDLRFAVGALLGALTLGPLAAMADQMVALESRTRLYAERASDVPQILEETFQIAQRARGSLAGVATLYTRLAPLGDSLGRSQMQLLRVVETVTKAFSIGGAAASEATAGAQQFAQALSSNRFGGDELRSVAENAPVLLAAIAEGVNQINPSLNLNAATFIKWAQAGNANSEIMVRALEAAAAKIDRMFASTTPTISQATVVVQNALTKMVDEVDRKAGEAGQRLSTGVALGLQDFASFLTRDSTIDALVGTIQAIRAAFDLTGAAINGVVTYFPALLTALGAFVVAMNAAAISVAIAPLVNSLAVAMTAVGLTFTGASGRALVFAAAQDVVSASLLRVRAAAAAVGAALAGPLGLAVLVTGAAVAFNYLAANSLSAAKAAEIYGNTQEGALSALERAILFSETYNQSTLKLEAALKAQSSASGEAAAGADATSDANSRARDLALSRANAERLLTVALLEREAAEATGAAEQLQRAAGVQRILGRVSQFEGNVSAVIGDRDGANQFRTDALERFQRAKAQSDQAAGAFRTAANLRSVAEDLRTPLTLDDLPAIADGSGVTQLGAAADNAAKGMAGAINSVAKLNAEVAGLNDQIKALDIDPLSDVAARIVSAGREAAASRTAGRGAGLADEAQIAAMLKEEATIRLDLSRSIVEQARSARQAAEATTIDLWANADAMQAMQTYYSEGVRSSERYAAALYAQSEAEVESRKTLVNLGLAQQFGVTSVSEISQAYQNALEAAGLLTDETKEYADALQRQAQETYEAEAAAIDLNVQLERQKRLNEARAAQQAATDDLIQYAAALRGGAEALDAYNRQKRVNAVLEAEGPAPTLVGRILQPLQATISVGRADQAAYTAELEKRSAEMREQVRLAELGTRAREIEVEALELAAAAGRSLATEADRAAAAFLIMGREAADLATKVQDGIRQGFIETGKLSFDSLKEALKRSIRQALYDALIAAPVNMVVKAVIEFTQKGLDEIMRFIKRALGGKEDGSMGDAIGKFFGSGGKFESFMSKFGDIGSKIGDFAKSAGKVLGGASAGYGVGSAVGDLIGLTGSGDGRQQMLDMAASVAGSMFGGPVGAALATLASRVLGGFIFDKKRPLAITAVEVKDGRFQSRGAQGYDGGPVAEIGEAGRELANMLNKLTKTFGLSLKNAEGLYAVFGFTAGENAKSLGGEGFFGGLLREFNSIAGKSLDQIKGSALGRGVDLSQVQDAEEALDKIMREVVIRIGATQQVPFTEAEKALIRAAESLEEAAATLKAARNIETDIQRALLQFTNPREFAVQNLRDQQLQRRQGILDLVDQGLVTQDRLPGIEQMLRELERAELGDVLGRFAEGLDGVISTLEDLRKAQERLAEYAQGLITGELSPLSPSARLSASQGEFQRLLTAANAGDASAMEKLTSASTDYLSAAQRYFASSPQYAQIFDQVYNQLLALSEKEFEDPLIGVIETEVQRLIDAINAGFLLIYGTPNPTTPDLPDVPGTPGVGTGGGVILPGVGGGGGGGDAALYGIMEQGFASVNEQLANVGSALVSAQRDGSQNVADAARDVPSFARALTGGGVSQSRMSA